MSARVDGACLAITVEDTGIGISEADLPRIGDPFFQARVRPMTGAMTAPASASRS